MSETLAQLCSTLGTRFVVFVTREAAPAVDDGAQPDVLYGRLTIDTLRAVAPKVIYPRGIKVLVGVLNFSFLATVTTAFEIS